MRCATRSSLLALLRKALAERFHATADMFKYILRSYKSIFSQSDIRVISFAQQSGMCSSLPRVLLTLRSKVNVADFIFQVLTRERRAFRISSSGRSSSSGTINIAYRSLLTLLRNVYLSSALHVTPSQ